jgi:enoyl-CoA hydratase/carnithine racemase
LRAVLLTGAGRAFSAGGDLAWLHARHAAAPVDNEQTMVAFYGTFLGHLRSLPVPTVACLHGPAIGAGLCLSLGCDVRVASADAKLGFTFVGLNLHPGTKFDKQTKAPGAGFAF